MAVVSSCSSGSSNASEEAVTAPTATSSPAAATSSTRTTTAWSTAAAAVDPSKLDGILVAVQPTDKDPLEIGTIDPTTGDYTKVGTFPNGAIGPNLGLSPDLTRMAAIGRDGNGYPMVGWYTINTTTFTPALPSPDHDPFNPPQTYRYPSFDFAGRLNYWVSGKANSAGEWYRLTPGSSAPPERLPDGEKVDWGDGLVLYPDGEPNEICDDVYSYVAPDRYLALGFRDQQIEIGRIDALGTYMTCGRDDNAVQLIPETNTAHLYNPVATRDKRFVAFTYDLSPQVGRDLYVVDIKGGGQPIRVPTTKQVAALIQWRD